MPKKQFFFSVDVTIHNTFFRLVCKKTSKETMIFLLVHSDTKMLRDEIRAPKTKYTHARLLVDANSSV